MWESINPNTGKEYNLDMILMKELTNRNTGKEYSFDMILIKDINKLTISDVCLLVILL